MHDTVGQYSDRSQKTHSSRIVYHFSFLPHFDAIFVLLLYKPTATWNLFVNELIAQKTLT